MIEDWRTDRYSLVGHSDNLGLLELLESVLSQCPVVPTGLIVFFSPVMYSYPGERPSVPLRKTGRKSNAINFW